MFSDISEMLVWVSETAIDGDRCLVASRPFPSKFLASIVHHPLPSWSTMGSGSSVAHDLTGEQKVALTKLIEEKYVSLQNAKQDDVEIFQTLKQ